MNYKELLYKNALKEIEEIYTQSKYDPDVDLYRSFDIINSINENQFKSKEWLVKEVLPYLSGVKHICVMGSWYGLVSLLVRRYVSDNVVIHNIDTDPLSKKFALSLTDGIRHKNTHFVVEDAADFAISNIEWFDLIINTSTEHMEQEDITMMTMLKKKKAIVCFQGNNYNEIQSHINTHDTLEEFVKSLDLNKVFFKESLATERYDRYMVIGR